MRSRAALGVCGVLLGCQLPAERRVRDNPPVKVTPEPHAMAAAPDAEEDAEGRDRIQSMLTKVSQQRGLVARARVRGKTLPRADVLASIRAHVARQMPEKALLDQGALLAIAGLVPREYRFAEEMFQLLERNVAGYYEPESGSMFLCADLTEREQDETLAHELVHALQDQHFNLKERMTYVEGDGDRLAAIHALAEGDALMAGMATLAGTIPEIPSAALSLAVRASVMTVEAGSSAPAVLRESLVAPYVDGYAFVQAALRDGGWHAVDEAWLHPPATTEQLLHPDKWHSREPAIVVDVQSPQGWQTDTVDTVGEQGLRAFFVGDAPLAVVTAAAAGWGGDRFALATSAEGKQAFFWTLVMDSDADAREIAPLVQARFGKECKDTDEPRAVWRRAGEQLSVVASLNLDCQALQGLHSGLQAAAPL